MPVYLPEPTADRPSDGKGWNRLSLNAHMGHGGAQCALRPLTYAAFIDSYNTMRAAWGGFGRCIRQQQGQCGTCPVLTTHTERGQRIPVNAPCRSCSASKSNTRKAPCSTRPPRHGCG